MFTNVANYVVSIRPSIGRSGSGLGPDEVLRLIVLRGKHHVMKVKGTLSPAI
jgi:hypothetical protein